MMVPDKICKCCGQTLPRAQLYDFRAGSVKAAMVARIIKAGKNGISSTALFDHLYGADPNGGPGSNAISVHKSQINQRLKKFKKKITAGQPGPGGCSVFRFVDL